MPITPVAHTPAAAAAGLTCIDLSPATCQLLLLPATLPADADFAAAWERSWAAPHLALDPASPPRAAAALLPRRCDMLAQLQHPEHESHHPQQHHPQQHHFLQSMAPPPLPAIAQRAGQATSFHPLAAASSASFSLEPLGLCLPDPGHPAPTPAGLPFRMAAHHAGLLGSGMVPTCELGGAPSLVRTGSTQLPPWDDPAAADDMELSNTPKIPAGPAFVPEGLFFGSGSGDGALLPDDDNASLPGRQGSSLASR